MELRHLRVAAYCRVSTDLEEQTSSIELQKRYYIFKISGNPNWENAGIFAERVTGLNLKERPEFHKMIRKCRKGEIALILTKSISRFGRNTLDMLQSLRSLRGLGIEVYFEQENMWLNEQRIEVLLTAYCALAQAESEDMSRNIKWGIKRGFEYGTSGYAEFVCFGYKRGDNGKLAIDEPGSRIVRQILFSGKQLKNRGELEQFLIHEHHPAIISKELFEAVNQTEDILNG